MNTYISGAMGGIVSAALKTRIMRNYSIIHRYDVLSISNGILAGLVSISASCNNVETWAAMIIGSIGSLIYCLMAKLL